MGRSGNDDDSSSSSSSCDFPPEDMEPKYGDAPSDMTNGRRIARHLSQKHSWYFPSKWARKQYEDDEMERLTAHERREDDDDDDDNDGEKEEEGLEVVPVEGSGAAVAANVESGEKGVAQSVFVEDAQEAGLDATATAAEVKPPSLDAAWAYFEHITLPRHFSHHHHDDDVNTDADAEGGGNLSASAVQRQNRARAFEEHTSLWGRTFGRFTRHKNHVGVDLLERAEPGESTQKTLLYSVLTTPESQLADFGVGVGLYFNSLRILGFIALVAGCLNIPVIQYFRSEEYAADAQDSISKGILKGSAICTDVSWQACPTCTREQWDTFPATFDRYAYADDPVNTGQTLHFIQNNECNVTETVGVWAFASLVWVVVSLYVFSKYSIKKEVAFDEAQQTAADYSLEVENPPVDGYDPEEWRTFFASASGGHVTVCTVALDNEDLIRVLRKRRRLLLSFGMGLPPGVELDASTLEEHLPNMDPKPFWKKLLCLGHYEDTLKAIRVLDGQIEEMSSSKYAVSNVFISFETEQAQRAALTKLSVRKLDVWRQNGGSLPDELLFRGKHVLSVREPPEPSAVRWQDLDESFFHQIIMRVVTTIISLGVIVVGGVLIALARRDSAATAAIVITILNTVTPQFVHHITNLESHSSEGSKQTSQYIKMTALRWCNTAIVTTIITPFTDTAQDGNGHLINGVYAIFITEMVKTPVLQIGDIMGNLNRHYFGPRAPDQRRMNLNFGGGAWRLSERYTDLTKVLFLCMFYSVVFPAGFFFTALTLFVHYWTDKFCLLRTWAPAPRLGTEISKFSRNYFFTLTILVYAIMLAYGYSTFPYDNACVGETQVAQDYVGTHNATSSDSKSGDPIQVSITITPQDTNYFFCNQDLIRYENAFPPLPSHQPEGAEWMTPGQETWSRVIGWTCIAVLCVVCVIFWNRIVIALLRKVFCQPYKPSGKAMAEKFSDVEEIYGYVPQVKIIGYPFPKLLCFVDNIDRGLVGWTDPYHSSDEHNLIFDVPKVAEAVKVRRSDKTADDKIVTDCHLFSIVKNWPPEGSKREVVT